MQVWRIQMLRAEDVSWLSQGVTVVRGALGSLYPLSGLSEHFLGSEPMTAANSSMQGPDWSRGPNSAQPPLLPLPLHLHLLLLILREGGSLAHHSGLGNGKRHSYLNVLKL